MGLFYGCCNGIIKRLVKQKPLKICLISSEFPSEETAGGIGTYTYNLAEGLTQIGHKVFVVTQYKPDFTTNIFKVEALGKPNKIWTILKKVLKISRFVQSLDSLEFSLRAYLKARQLHKKYKLDFIEGPEWRGQLFFVSIFLKVPFIIRLHTYTKKILELEGTKENLDYKLIYFLEKFTLIKSRNILAASEIIKKDAAYDFKINPDKIRLLALPINTGLFKGKKNKQPPQSVLFTGRLEVKKGILDLFSTISQVKKYFPKVVFKFAGKDQPYLENLTMKQYVLKLAEKQGILKNISFLGHIPYRNLSSQYLNSTIFVNPSKYESFSMTVLESLALNTPVILYKNLGIAKLVSQNNLGIVLNNKKFLAKAIIKLLKNPNKKTSDFIVKNFSSKIIAKETVKIYLSGV